MFSTQSKTSRQAKPESKLGPGKPQAGTPQPNRLWQQLATRVQPKLAVSAPDDPYEREADQVADQVMRMPESAAVAATGGDETKLQRKCACGGSSAGGECEECKHEREGTIQRKAASAATAGFAPPIVHDVLRSQGQPLDIATRNFFEPRFDQDFGSVRVHTGARAAESARAINSLAFTVGRDVVFGAEQYAPETGPGQRLLAHELAHVAQSEASQPSAPPLRRRLLATGSTPDVRAFLDMLGPPAGVWLRYDPATSEVTIGSFDQAPPKSGALLSQLNRLITSTVDTKIHLGQHQPGAGPAIFDQPGSPGEQALDVDDFLKIEADAPGSGVALAAHELEENFQAQQKTGPWKQRYVPSHEAAKPTESAVAQQLVGPGQRAGSQNSTPTHPTPTTLAYTEFFDYTNYYLALEMIQDAPTKDISVKRACRIDKVTIGTHTLPGFAADGSKLPAGTSTRFHIDVVKDMNSVDVFTVLIEGFAAPGETSPDDLSRARAQAFFDDVGAFKGQEMATMMGRGVVTQATPGHPEKDRKVVVTVSRPAALNCPALAQQSATPAPPSVQVPPTVPPPVPLQKKLAIGDANDPLEHEADRVADQVMRMAEPKLQRSCAACAAGGAPCPKCEEEQKEEPPAIHRKAHDSGDRAGPSVPDGFLSNLGPGRPLDPATRSFMEPRFGRDFGDVRVHVDPMASRAARSIHARAFTSGSIIAFAPGEFQPNDANGRKLLAHELAHVVQQGESALRRDPAPPGPAQPAANAQTAKPAPPGTRGYVDSFSGVTISESKEQVVFALQDEVAKGGITAADNFLARLEDFAGPGLDAARRFKKDFEDDRSGVSGGTPESDAEIQRREKVRDVLLTVVRAAVADVNAESTKVLSDFQQVMKDNALQTLAASKTRTEAERIRYGITTTKTTRVVAIGKGGPVREDITTHSIGDVQSPTVKGMREAAKLLLSRRYVLRAKAQELNKHQACHMGACGKDSEYDRVAGEEDVLRKDYRNLQQQISFQYPILDRMSSIDEDRSLTENAVGSLTELERVANTTSEVELATTAGERIEEALVQNERARAGVEADRVNLWRLKDIYGLSKTQVGVDSEPYRKKLIEQRWQSEQPNVIDSVLEAIALLVLNIGAILAAAPTGGASLALAFGVNAALAVKHTTDYLLEKAVGGSDLRRAQSLTQDDPSLVWLAVEIIGVGLDAASAVTAIRAMGPVVKAAQAASKEGKLTAEAIDSIKNAAKPFEKPQLAENVLKKLPKGNVAVLEAIAPASEKEIGQFARATRAIEVEAAETIAPSVRSAAGTEVKISKAGHCLTCSSPCQLLRDKYAGVLAAVPKLEGEATTLERQLVELEKRATQAAGDVKLAKGAEQIASAKKGAEAVERDIAAFEEKLQGVKGLAVDLTEKQAQRLQRVSEALKDESKWGNVSANDRWRLGRVYDKLMENLVGAGIQRAGGKVLHYVELDAKLINELRASGERVLITEGRIGSKGLRFDMLEIDFAKGRAELIDLAAQSSASHLAKTRSYKNAVENLLKLPVEAKELLYSGPKGELLETLVEVLVK